MIFFGMAQWLRLGALARPRSHRKMFTVVTFMSPPVFYVFVSLPAGIAEGWVIWCDVARGSEIGHGRKNFRSGRNGPNRVELPLFSETGRKPKRPKFNGCLMIQVFLEGKSLAPKWKKSANKSLSQPSCSHSNTICEIELQKTIVLPM